MKPSSAVAAMLLGVSVAADAASARALLTVDEALTLAFPGAQIERGTIFLMPPQLDRAERLTGQKPGSAIVHPYVARKDGAVIGTAYFDVHVVRTLAETVMVAIDPEGRIGRIEVLSFDEPPEYLPRAGWYRQFEGRKLDAELELRRAIRPVAGATLTARATTDAARRVLALHRVVTEAASAPAREGGAPKPPAGAE